MVYYILLFFLVSIVQVDITLCQSPSPGQAAVCLLWADIYSWELSAHQWTHSSGSLHTTLDTKWDQDGIKNNGVNIDHNIPTRPLHCESID